MPTQGTKYFVRRKWAEYFVLAFFQGRIRTGSPEGGRNTAGRRPLTEEKKLYSSLAQLAERMTVNHDVAGSSPAGGANPKGHGRKVMSLWICPSKRAEPAPVCQTGWGLACIEATASTDTLGKPRVQSPAGGSVCPSKRAEPAPVCQRQTGWGLACIEATASTDTLGKPRVQSPAGGANSKGHGRKVMSLWICRLTIEPSQLSLPLADWKGACLRLG